CKASHCTVMDPGPNLYGPSLQSRSLLDLLALISNTPRSISPEPSIDRPQPAYHQPRFPPALGGRSPTRRVLLAPSRTSISRTRESRKSNPSLVYWLTPSTPRYDKKAMGGDFSA